MRSWRKEAMGTISGSLVWHAASVFFSFFFLISIFSPRGFGADRRPHGWNRNMCALSMQEMVSAVQQVQASSHLNELGEAFRKVPGHDKWKTKELTRKSRNSQNLVSPMLLNVQLLRQINERCNVYSQVVFQPPHLCSKSIRSFTSLLSHLLSFAAFIS